MAGEIHALMENIGTSSAGIKLAFSFAWNGKNKAHNPRDVVSTPVLSPEAHLFRQDVDAYYLALAARLGPIFASKPASSRLKKPATGCCWIWEKSR